MNSYMFMGIDLEEEKEVTSRRKKTFIKRAIAFIKSRRVANWPTRNIITRDRAGAHQRLFAAFFSEDPCLALDHFCEAVMQIYGLEFLRKPTVTDVEKLYLHHEEKHGFSGMLGSLDCTDWEWFSCPYAFKEQYVRRDHGPNPFILLKAVASQDLWIWHAFFGVAGSNKDINIYPELAPLVKTIPESADDDQKRILYKQKQEWARKDVERVFGVLKNKWADRYEYSKNHEKTVKNGQTWTRETEEHKRSWKIKPRKVNIQSTNGQQMSKSKITI
ncbi:ALP1-like protein [Tanacetum coccineum]